MLRYDPDACFAGCHPPPDLAVAHSLMRFIRPTSAILCHPRRVLRAYEIVSRGTRLCLLVAFVSTSIGVPVGNWSRVAESDRSIPTSSCRCSTSTQRARSCCCAKSPAGATADSLKPGGCCAARVSKTSCELKKSDAAKPKVGGCCSQKPAAKTAKADTPEKRSSSETPSWTALCSCGPNEEPGVLVDHSPKLVAVRRVWSLFTHADALFEELIVSAIGLRSEPTVPPPEFSLLG